ncbi:MULTISPECIES: hypothetical protein [Bacillus]|nr:MULTISPECIES: hypothetical protein [Bacillus]MCD2526258.1 hypothetical protein [Bacillus licheniformis]
MAKNNKVKSYYLDEESINYISEFDKQNGIGGTSRALRKIINDHKKYSSDFFENLKQAMKEVVSEDLSRIRAGTNLADKNSRMLLEFMNHLFVVNQYKELVTTEKYKSKGITEAELVVKNQIANARMKKLDRENREIKK